MKSTLLTAGLLCSALMAPAAFAQSPAPPLGSTDSGSGNSQLVTQQALGNLRVSDLIDEEVVGPDGEELGEIEDVVLDRNGRVAGVVVELDGSMGLGGREVAVPISALRIDPTDATVSTGTIQGEGLPASTPEGQQTREQNRISRVLAPERIMLTIPMDQLRSAPAFSDDDDDD